jgi:hypothetical protein
LNLRLPSERARIAILSLLGACQQAPAGRPAPSRAPETAAARLSLARSRHDLGTVLQDEPVHAFIPVTNTGTLPLEIGAIDRSRFCSAAIAPKVIAPGAVGQLEVTCRSDLYGPMREPIDIHSSDAKAETRTLELVANVTPLLAFDTQVVDLKMPFGEERSQEVRLVGALIDKARIKLTSSGIESASVIEPLRGPKDEARGFRIRCTGKKVGQHVGNLIVSTGLARPKEIAMPYACKVAGTLEISPTNPYFNLKVSGPKLVSIEVRSSQPGFKVHGARVAEGPFEAALNGQTSEGAFRVQVKVIEERLAEDVRSATGKVIVFSNDRTEPEKEIPLFGFGKANPEKAEGSSPATN